MSRSAAGGRRQRRWSLRARLLVAFLVPLVVVLGVVLLISTTALSYQLITQVDAQLAAAVSRSSTAFQPGGDEDDRPGGPDFLGAHGHGAGTLGAHIVGGVPVQAGVIADRGPDQGLSPEQAGRLAVLPADGRARTVDLGGDLGEYRVVAMPAPDGDGGGGGGGDAIVTGLPLAGAENALGRLSAVQVLVALVGVAAAALAGGWAIRRTLRPLDRVAGTATRVAQLPLARGEVLLADRVPAEDTDPRTEVGQVGAALNRLLDHVEGSLAARQASEMQVRQFVADASHELRTPLSSIRGYAELVRRQGQQVPDDVAHALRRVESEALRMSVLVDDLLLLAHLDAGRDLAHDEVDLTALTVDTVSDAHAASPGHHWLVDLPDRALLVPGDPARLHQVLANLLANVGTHTPAGTTATVRLRAEHGWARLEVTDEGPGIAPALLGHVFERFARGDSSRSRTAGSSGLGLAIVHAVVAAHRGTVAVASQPGRTVFTLHLPVTADVGTPHPIVTSWPRRSSASAVG